MADFTKRMRLKGKAEEDIYFAELNRKLAAALREKQIALAAGTDKVCDKKDDAICAVPK